MKMYEKKKQHDAYDKTHTHTYISIYKTIDEWRENGRPRKTEKAISYRGKEF